MNTKRNKKKVSAFSLFSNHLKAIQNMKNVLYISYAFHFPLNAFLSLKSLNI